MLHILLIGVIVFIAGMAWGAFFMLEFIRRSDAPSDFANAVLAQFDRRIVRGTIPTRATQVGGDHYRSKAIQPWDAMESWMSPEQFKGFLRGNAIKYLARCDDKGGIEDIKKAAHYIAKMTEGK